MTNGRVELSWGETCFGASVGARRRARAVAANRYTKVETPPLESWGRNIEGALAEMAFAKATNLYWVPTDDLDKAIGDVGGFHIRSTDNETGSLILRPDDSDVGWFVLMVGRGNRWRLAGMLRAADGKQDRYWRREPFPSAWFVPQGALKPFENGDESVLDLSNDGVH